MKPALIIKLVLATFFTSFGANAVSYGVPSVAGNGCPASNALFTRVPNQANRYNLVNRIALVKGSNPAVARKTCLFRLPVKLAANERLVVSNVSQSVNLMADKGTTMQTSLEIFFAGQHGNPLTAQLKGVTSASRTSQVLEARGVVAQSACGQDVILSGNLAASAVGLARGSAITGDVQLNIQTESCNRNH